jgi:hypothetical protein
VYDRIHDCPAYELHQLLPQNWKRSSLIISKPPKSMTDHGNKDLLIAVMGRQQQELEKMVKLQADQLSSYREHVDAYKVLLAKI